MKRLGKFTKTIYPDDYDLSQCPECCTQISDDKANDEEFVNNYHVRDLMDCLRCMGCPAAQKSRV
jgi:uncharacterized protein with PIN domain